MTKEFAKGLIIFETDFSWKSQKNQKVGVFETNFKQVPFVFRQTTSTYSESWGPVENFSDFRNAWFHGEILNS